MKHMRFKDWFVICSILILTPLTIFGGLLLSIHFKDGIFVIASIPASMGVFGLFAMLGARWEV